MFRVISNTEDPLAHSEEKAENRHPSTARSGSKSPASTHHDKEAIERAETQDDDGRSSNHDEEKGRPPRPSAELKRTASNALSRVASRVTTRSITDPGPPPDGGLKAWTQVACGFVAIMTTWGWINSFGAFQTYYTLTLDESPSTISWIGTVQNFLTFFLAAVSGRLLDAGVFMPTLVLGVSIQVLGIFMMSLCKTYWQLLITQGIMTGLGGGIFFTPALGLVATYFSKKRALALSFASTGNAVGGVIYPVIVRQLLPKIGFAWTTRVLGFFNLAVLGLVIAFMRPRLPPRKSGALVDWSAFSELPYVCLTVGMFFQIWSIYFIFYYLASYGVQVLGLSFSNAATLVIIINGVGIPARIAPGFIVVRFGSLNTIAPLCVCAAGVAWCWLAVENVTGFYVFTCFYGFMTAAFQSLLPMTVSSLTPDMKMVGTRLGMLFTCVSFAALTGPVLGGAIVGAQNNSYFGSQMYAAGCSTVAATLFVIARMGQANWKIKAGII